MRKGRESNLNNPSAEDILEEELGKNNKTKKQIIILIVFTIVVIILTSTLIFLKIKNNKQENVNNVENEEKVQIEEVKKQSEDTKYLLTGFDEMYYINPITFTEKEYKNGKIKVDKENRDKVDVEYYQISGLKNKEIQSKINKEIKDSALSLTNSLKTNEYVSVYTNIVGNFNNILSINITAYVYNSKKEDYSKDEHICLNYNLVTGDKIRFHELFASNTPINSLISNMYYMDLAWKTDVNFEDYEKYLESTDMNKRDTSEYEDKILQAIRRFEKLDKDKINFCISPKEICLMESLDKNNIDWNGYEEELYKYMDYIVAYKRFLTNDDIFENKITKKRLVFNSYYNENKIVSTDNYESVDDFYTYGFKNDNMFMFYVLTDYNDGYTKSQEKLKDSLVKKYIDLSINNVVKKYNTDNNDYIIRGSLRSDIYEEENDYGKEKFISVTTDVIVSKMNKGTLKTIGLKALAIQNDGKYADVGSFYFGSLNSKNINNIEEKDKTITFDYYFDLKGNLVAKSYKELEKYMNNKYKPSNNSSNQINVYIEN